MSCWNAGVNWPYFPLLPGAVIFPFDPVARCNCPPSPIPPWHREDKSGLTQTIFVADTINLAVQTTYLNAALNSPPSPISVALPDGNFKNQSHQIFIPGAMLGKTETFLVNGNFAGFSQLVFDPVGFSALLIWDGTAWQLQGGNAKANTNVTPPNYVTV